MLYFSCCIYAVILWNFKFHTINYTALALAYKLIGSATMRWLQLGMLASEGTNSYSCSLLPQPLIYGLERLYRNEKNLILPYISFIGYILNAHNSYTLDSHTRVRLCMHAKKKHLVRLNKQACLYPKFSRKKLRKRCDTSVASN